MFFNIFPLLACTQSVDNLFHTLMVLLLHSVDLEARRVNIEECYTKTCHKTCGQCGYTSRSVDTDACPAKGETCNNCYKRDDLERKMYCQRVKPSILYVKETVINDDAYFRRSIHCDGNSPAWKVDYYLNYICFKCDIHSGLSGM